MCEYLGRTQVFEGVFPKKTVIFEVIGENPRKKTWEFDKQALSKSTKMQKGDKKLQNIDENSEHFENFVKFNQKKTQIMMILP